MVGGMPVQMYRETRFMDLQVRRHTYYIWLDAERHKEFSGSHIHCMKYAEVINVSSAAN